jgi:hypothetical protein
MKEEKDAVPQRNTTAASDQRCKFSAANLCHGGLEARGCRYWTCIVCAVLSVPVSATVPVSPSLWLVVQGIVSAAGDEERKTGESQDQFPY